MRKKKKIIIWGSAGHGSAVLDLINNIGLSLFTFLDENPKAKSINKSRLIKGKKNISSFLEKKNDSKKFLYTVAIGSNQKIRLNIYNNLKKMGFKIPILAHRTAYISRTAKINNGTQIFANTNIGPNTIIGESCIINNNSNVDHDCNLGDGVHIAPGAILCGGIKIGNNTLIGANSTILPYLKIGSNCIIGAGTVVTKNVKSGTIYYKKK